MTKHFKSEPWKAPKTPPPSLVINKKRNMGERFGAETLRRGRLGQVVKLLGLGIRPAVIEKVVNID